MSQFTTIRAQENTAAGNRGGMTGLALFLLNYMEVKIDWDVVNFLTIVDWREFIYGSAVAYFGIGAVTAFFRDQPAPWKTVEEGPFKAPENPVERITHRIEPELDEEFDLALSDEWTFSAASEKKLSEAHPDLVKVARRALQISKVDFGVISAYRTAEEQRQKVASGASKTMSSRHRETPAMAIDIACYVDGKITWTVNPHYLEANRAFEQAAKELDIELTTGLSWGNVFHGGPDAGHFELSRDKYPYNGPA